MDVSAEDRRRVQEIKDDDRGGSILTTGLLDWQRQRSVDLSCFQVANSNTVSSLSSRCLFLILFSSYSFFCSLHEILSILQSSHLEMELLIVNVDHGISVSGCCIFDSNYNNLILSRYKFNISITSSKKRTLIVRNIFIFSCYATFRPLIFFDQFLIYREITFRYFFCVIDFSHFFLLISGLLCSLFIHI